jgi:hypothetical protein
MTARPFAVLLLVLAAPRAGGAQIPGDSVRFRIPGAAWQYGTIILPPGDSLLHVRQGELTTGVSLLRIQRLDRWQRLDRGDVITWMVSGCMIAGALAAFLVPEPDRPDPLATGAVGAGMGLVLALVTLEISPGRWRVVISR